MAPDDPGASTGGDAPAPGIFEQIRQEDESGNELWPGRDLAVAPGYTDWRNFRNAVARAREACETSGYAASDHFVDTTKTVTLGSSAGSQPSLFAEDVAGQ
jgi:hypothetical protein